VYIRDSAAVARTPRQPCDLLIPGPESSRAVCENTRVQEQTPSRFPQTRPSVVAAIGNADPEVRRCAFEALVTSYWKPVYKYLRLRWHIEPEQAEDLTQGFFTHAFEKGTLRGYDPARARFRTWLRTCLDGFVSNERRAAQRLKRGGQVRHLSLEFEDAEGELRHVELVSDADTEALFHREWVRGMVTLALHDLRVESQVAGRGLEFSIFERYDVERADGAEAVPSYSALGKEFEVSTTKVTNALHAMRRRFRRAVLERLRAISANESEFELEARDLFGDRR